MPCLAQTQSLAESTAEITALQEEVSSLREQINLSQEEISSLQEQVISNRRRSASSVAFLFGLFCAMCAQNTKCNP
jgi:septal ring factor EnvC (AmiA/AmiB activator)